jgi:hypothetical protein
MGMTHFVENTKRNTKQGVMITKPNSTYGEKTHTVWQPNPKASGGPGNVSG